MSAPGGFVPPPYPYARLSRLAEVADRHPGGLVDLSAGIPCDPPPAAAVSALAGSRTESGYPSSIGSEALRRAAAAWIGRRFEVDVDPVNIAACVGTKEFVASVVWYLRLRDGSRDTVIAPATSYPTYAMGAQLAGCRVVGAGEHPEGGLDLSSVPEEVARRALVLWLNSPSNPTGSLSNLDDAAEWGRSHGVAVFSDECYAEFTWEPASASTILRAGADGVVAVHSLSKRSNMAGLRVGFYAGDPELVRYLGVVRQHAGLMVPGPVQAAAVSALDDDEHVLVQRERYRRRLVRLAEILRAAGLEVSMPAGGFYLWVPVPAWCLRGGEDGGTPAWALTERLARAAGALVSPGEFYGDGGASFVRIAAVQPDERIELVAQRLAGSSLRDPGAPSERGHRSLR